MTFFLSKVRISDSPSAQALGALLSPVDPNQRMAAHHRLLWAAFTDGPERTRDFLWREEGQGVFLTLSARPPVQMDLFAPHETKAFAPELRAGDSLGFKLRANATRAKRGGPRVDVVMDALHGVAPADRADARMGLAQREGVAWLERQGSTAGFHLTEGVVEGYSAHALEGHRGPRKGQPQFGILEMSGRLEVTDPSAFLAQMALGFGRAKAFGCGLMLVRRG